MPLLRINATSQGLKLHDRGQAAPVDLTDLGPHRGPAIIMLHGHKYAPNHVHHCPHESLFSRGPGSWPDALGFGADDPQDGLCVAFGWYARKPLREAHRHARDQALGLASLIRALRQNAPERPVHLIAHSLGSETALSVLPHLPAHAVARIILLTGASFARHAAAMLSTPAGRTAEIFNVTSRENDLFDLGIERIIPDTPGTETVIGRGIEAANAVTLQLDCPETLEAINSLGFAVAGPERRVCHWSSYTRPGVMSFYAELLRAPARLPMAQLQALLPQSQTPRWSRLWNGSVPEFGSLADLAPLATPLVRRLKKRIMAATAIQGKNNEHAY